MTDVEQAISDRWAGFKAAVENEDYEAWASYWTQDAWVLEPGMDVRGSTFFDAVRELFATGVEFQSFDAQPFETFVHGDVAYQIGQYDEAYQIPGTDPIKAQNYAFTRWVNDGGAWKIDRFLAGPRKAPAQD